MNTTLTNENIIVLKITKVITQVMTINQFIENECQTQIQAEITKNFPKAKTINKDYKIVINDLNGDNILQDEQLLIKVIPLKEKKMDKALLFSATIEYDYDNDQQIKAIDGILNKAIPQEFIAVTASKKFNFLTKENSSTEFPKYGKMVRNVIPLRVLLAEPHLSMKLFVELQATCKYLNNGTTVHLYSLWDGIWSTFTNERPSEIIIPNKNNAITNVQKLYQINNTYFNKLFYLIEKKLHNSGVKDCSVNKTMISDKDNRQFCFAVGNASFIEDPTVNSDNNWDENIYSNRNLFIQVSLEVNFNHTKRLYPGVVLLLSDKLSVYDNDFNINFQNAPMAAPPNPEADEIDEAEQAKLEASFNNSSGWF